MILLYKLDGLQPFQKGVNTYIGIMHITNDTCLYNLLIYSQVNYWYKLTIEKYNSHEIY